MYFILYIFPHFWQYYDITIWLQNIKRRRNFWQQPLLSANVFCWDKWLESLINWMQNSTLKPFYCLCYFIQDTKWNTFSLPRFTKECLVLGHFHFSLNVLINRSKKMSQTQTAFSLLKVNNRNTRTRLTLNIFRTLFQCFWNNFEHIIGLTGILINFDHNWNCHP